MQAARLIRRALPLVLIGAAGLVAARRRMESRELAQLPESPLGAPASSATSDSPPGGGSELPVVELATAPGPEGGEPVTPATGGEAEPAGVEPGLGVPTVVDADPAGPTVVVDVEVLPDAPEAGHAVQREQEPEREPEPEPDAEPIAEQEPAADPEAPTTEVPALEEPPTSVTDIVDDLIAPHPAGGERIEDATVVEGDEPGTASGGTPGRG